MAKLLSRLFILLLLLSLCHCKSPSSSRSKKKSKKHKLGKISDSSSAIDITKSTDITSRELRKRKRKEKRATEKREVEVEQAKASDLYLSDAVLSTQCCDFLKGDNCFCKTKSFDTGCECDRIMSLSVVYLGDIDASVVKVFDTFTKRPRCKFNRISPGDELICGAEDDDDDDVFSDSTTFKLKRKDGTSCVGYVDTSCNSEDILDAAINGCDDIIVTRYTSGDDNICDHGLSPCECDDEPDASHSDETHSEFTSSISRLVTEKNIDNGLQIIEPGDVFADGNDITIDLEHDIDEITLNPTKKPTNKPTYAPSYAPTFEDDLSGVDAALDPDSNNNDLVPPDLYHESMEPAANKVASLPEEPLIHIGSQGVNADTPYAQYMNNEAHIDTNGANAYIDAVQYDGVDNNVDRDGYYGYNYIKNTEESASIESDEDDMSSHYYYSDHQSSYDYSSESLVDYSDEESESYESYAGSESDHESLHHYDYDYDEEMSSKSKQAEEAQEEVMDEVVDEVADELVVDEVVDEVVDQEMRVIPIINQETETQIGSDPHDIEEDKKIGLSNWAASFLSLKNDNELESSSGYTVYSLYSLCAVLLGIVVVFVLCLYKKGLIRKHMMEEHHMEVLEACVSGSDTDRDDLTVDEDELL